MEDALVVELDPSSIDLKVNASAGSSGVGSKGASSTTSSAGALARRLWAAALQGDAHTVTQLMAGGAPFTTDWVGAGPLHCAAHGGSAAAARALLRAGAHTHARTKVERTALHIAAYHGHLETVEVLLEHMADPNTRDLVGMSALHWASARRHAAVVRTLLLHGADPSLEDRLHATPHDLTDDAHILELLHNHQLQQQQQESKPTIAPSPPPPEVDLSNTLESSEVLLKRLKQAHRTVGNNKFKHHVVQGPLSDVCAGALRRLRALEPTHTHAHTHAHTDTEHAHTLLSAMRHGRTLLLSDAGKLLLKESGLDSKILANNQRSSNNTQITTINQHTTFTQPMTTNQSATTNQPTTTYQLATTNQPTTTSSVTTVSSAIKGKRIVRMVNMRGKQNDQLESFTLKKIILPEDNQVRYVAVPRKFVIQKVPPSSVSNVVTQIEEDDGETETAGETLVQTQEENEESELMRLRQQVTSLRKRLSKYEPISDDDE